MLCNSAPVNKENFLDEVTMRSVAIIFSESKRAEIGVCFIPDGEGWILHYLKGNHGGLLAQGPTLLAAARAGVKELKQLWPEDQQSLVGAVAVVLPDEDEGIA